MRLHAALAHALAETEAQTVQPWLEPAPYPACSRARGGGGGDRRLHEGVALTPAEAQRLQDDARVSGCWLMWFVSYERTGKFIARAHTGAPDGGRWLPGELVADTLPELRAMLPAGLTRWERTSVMTLERL